MLRIYSERQPSKTIYQDGTIKRFDPFVRWYITNGWVEFGIPNNNAIGFMWKCRIGEFSIIKKWFVEFGIFTLYVNHGTCRAYNPRTGKIFEDA
jgi:hypothetical protein